MDRGLGMICCGPMSQAGFGFSLGGGFGAKHINIQKDRIMDTCRKPMGEPT